MIIENEVVILYHITSFEAAYSILKGRFIHGEKFRIDNLEALPHFYIDSKERGYNAYNNVPQLEIVFGSYLKVVEKIHFDVFENGKTINYKDNIISIYTNHNSEHKYWQSVIRPEAINPLFVIGYKLIDIKPPLKLIKELKKHINAKTYIQVRWFI